MKKFTDKINESITNTEINTDNILSEYKPIFYEDGHRSTGTAYSIEDVKESMVKFAKLHVDAALKVAHNNMQLPEEDLDYTLSSYPESNIK